jgi:hypothetical protein
MASSRPDAVDVVVRQMLDAMRNAHLQMVLGDPPRAIEYLDEAAIAHSQLNVLFQGDTLNQSVAGRILYQVIGQRMDSLSQLAHHCLKQPLPAAEVVAYVAKPLDPPRNDT